MTVYDAHCHVFNGNLLIDMIHIPEHKKMEVARVGSDLHHWWGYMKELGMIFVDSEKANNEYLIRKMKEHFPDANAATVPLMMDTHFLLADDLLAASLMGFLVCNATGFFVAAVVGFFETKV